MEIHQEAYANLAHAEIGENLGVVGWGKRGNCFDFNDNGVLDHDVGAEAQRDRFAFVNDGDGDLTLKFYVGFL